MASPSIFGFANSSFAKDLGSEFVTIIVGRESKRFALHKKVLTSQSDYFDKALNGGFQEAVKNEIRFEDDNPDAIALLIEWLYRGVVQKKGAVEGSFDVSDEEVRLPQYGTRGGFEPVQESDPAIAYFHAGTLLNIVETSIYHSITAHPRYAKYSFEELRLADYVDDRRYADDDCDSNLHDLADISHPGNQNGNDRTATNPGVTFARSAYPVSSRRVLSGSSASSSDSMLAHPDSERMTRAASHPQQSSLYDPFITSTATTPDTGGSSLITTQATIPPVTPRFWRGRCVTPQTQSQPSPVLTGDSHPSSSRHVTPSSVGGTAGSSQDSSPLGQFSTGALFSALSNHLSSEKQFPGNSISTSPRACSRQGTSQQLQFNFKSPFTFGADITFAKKKGHQMALLHLAIFAEKTCWANLYNEALAAYIRGERSLQRVIPLEHVALIFDRTHENSSLQRYALDKMTGLPKYVDPESYIELAMHNEVLCEGMIRKMLGCEEMEIDGFKALEYEVWDDKVGGRKNGKSADFGHGEW